MSYIRKRRQAFYYAGKGLMESFRRESHMKIHGAAAVLVTAAGFYFDITQYQWLAVLACITLVLSAELLNTALEKLCDIVQPHNDERIRYIKDISAAFVLLVCFMAFFTGCIIFIPYLKVFAAMGQ